MKSLLLATLITLPAFAGPSVNATNKMGLKLALEAAQKEKGNYMVSPLSLMQALNLAANGTDHGTRAEVETLLGADLAILNADSAQLVKKISLSPEEKKTLEAQNNWVHPAVVGIHNSIWNTNGATDNARFTFSPEFKNIAATHFNAESKTLDFKKAESVKAINGWADKKTNGLVKEIINADTLKDLLWIVMNATYIESNWSESMRLVTRSVPVFTLENGEKTTPAMIEGKQYIAHKEFEGGSVVASLPFSSAPGKAQLEMVIYLPALGTKLDSARAKFFSHNFWLNSVQGILAERREEARIVLPKFSFDTSVEMKKDDEITKNLGLNFLFSNFADFTRMATADSYTSAVGLIKQNTRIELDEKGVKAAAVTIIGGVRTTSMPVEPRLSLTVDRPFLFAIVEKQSQAILFAGSVLKP